jgi:3D (Asp-Asp-Asp) domain-containing protein
MKNLTIKEAIGIGVFLGTVVTILFIWFINPNANQPCIPDVVHDTLYVQKVRGTYYNPTKLNITANGTKLSKKHDKKVVALSRNLFQRYCMGDSLYIISPARLAGAYYICDKLNKRFTDRIDIFTYGSINIDSVVIRI